MKTLTTMTLTLTALAWNMASAAGQGDTPWHALGELQRLEGKRSEAVETLWAGAARNPEAPEAAAAREEAIWWSLPLTSATRAQVLRRIGKLPATQPPRPWTCIFRLLSAVEQGNVERIVAEADALRSLPANFPSHGSDLVALQALRGRGIYRADALLRVLAARDHSPLYALRDLDHALTREALAAGQDDGQAEHAARLTAARDRLRDAYAAAARHIVERLFALELQQKTAERNALFSRARALPYLWRADALKRAVAGLSPEDAERLLLTPLFEGELAFLDAAPDLPSNAASSETAPLQISADKTLLKDDTTVFSGHVQAVLAPLSIECDELTTSAADRSRVTGHGHVKIRGIRGFEQGARADMFVLSTMDLTLRMTGAVEVTRADGSMWKTEDGTLDARGTILHEHSLLDTFAAEPDVLQRLALLPRISQRYTPDELPADVRYLMALRLIEPHLTWHARTVQPPDKGKQFQQAIEAMLMARARRAPDFAWQEADAGEPWMRERAAQAIAEARKSAETKKRERAEKTRLQEASASLRRADASDVYWRLATPDHADIKRALTLLRSIHVDPWQRDAQRWAAELERNNTVLTFDIPRAIDAGAIVADLRAVDTVRFELHRVTGPDTLADVCARIGKDFIFREFGSDTLARAAERAKMLAEKTDLLVRPHSKRELPAFTAETRVAAWSTDADAMPRLAGWWRHRRSREDYGGWKYDRYEEGWWGEQPDAWYFGDVNEEHDARLEYEYLPDSDGTPSSWKTHRIVKVPDVVLEPGGYVLVAEANGVKAYAPLFVDPLQMTLGRCRDGVLAAVSSAADGAPLKGATFAASVPLHNTAVSDEHGIAFVKLAAIGDAAIVAAQNGRYAIGGFGRVFEGIYATRERWRWMKEVQRQQSVQHLKRARQAHSLEKAQAVYEDRYVMAAYTDRPTYRPGQDVNFKLIVRHLPPQDKPVAITRDDVTAFRAEDFNLAATLTLPPADALVRYDVVSPRGRTVHAASLACNDFGTAAGAFALNSETPTGPYTLRVHIDGVAHVLPNVFTVKYYRRPNFSVALQGAPTNLDRGRAVQLDVKADYYFGRPVARARVQVQLASATIWRPYESITARLNEKGQCTATLDIPRDLPPGAYVVLATVTDDSGRSVSALQTCHYDAAARSDVGDVRTLPLFARIGATVSIPYHGQSVTHYTPQGATRKHDATKKESVRVELTECGWHTFETDAFTERVFVYGGLTPPIRLQTERQQQRPWRKKTQQAPLDRWVDLADYAHFERPDARRRYGWHNMDEAIVPPPSRVLALFDRRRVRVGEDLTVLVCLPDVRGKARVLFTYEGRTIVDYRTLELSAAPSIYHVVKLPITERHVPNFYLQAHVLSDAGTPRLLPTEERQPQAAQEAQQAAELAMQDDWGDGSEDPLWCRVDVLTDADAPAPEALSVETRTDSRLYEPGADVAVQFEVTDSNGKPCEAELSLSAVDESVYVFGEGRETAIAAWFASARPSRRFKPKAWRTSLPPRRAESAEAMMAQQEAAQAMQMAMEKAFSVAADALLNEAQAAAQSMRPERPVPMSAIAGLLPLAGLVPARLRMDFRETAAWLPQIRTDPAGRAEAHFKLPDSLTRYRLTTLALTRDTRFGTATTDVTALLPVSLQVFLPRFAVEKDEFTAMVVVHNTTRLAQRLSLTCTVQGAELAVAPLGRAWTLEKDGQADKAQRDISVPANGSTPVGIPLRFGAAGRVTLHVEASNPAHADAEERSLIVHPLGRAAKHVLEGDIQGTTAVPLPKGFRPDTLAIRVTRVGEVTAYDALEGLEYLVQYPYGCVEQTMSRFLPAVMVQHAVHQRSLELSSAVLAQLPEVLAKGAERLYTFQQKDGGWGWWKDDRQHVGMTLYVLYGLTRCRLAGRDVDSAVLDRGYTLLETWLEKGLLRDEADERVMARAQRGRACYILAMAGRIDRARLKRDARAMGLDAGAEALLNMTLACHAAGLRSEAHRLWTIARTIPCTRMTEQALFLQAQVRMGETPAACLATAKAIAAARSGRSWGNTRDTSWAMEALAEAIPILPPPAGDPIDLRVECDDKTIFRSIDDATAAETKATQGALLTTNLTQATLAGSMAPVLRLHAVSSRLLRYSITTEGTDHLDLQQARGDVIQCQHRYRTDSGHPVTGAVKQGSLLTGTVTVRLAQPQHYLMVEVPRPAGFEFAHDQLAGPLASRAAHVEFRDTRLCASFAQLPAGEHTFTYLLRAETAGQSHVLPVEAYPMYRDSVRGSSAAVILTVLAR